MFDEIYFQTQEDFPMSLVLGFSVGPFQLSDHVVQNRQTGEQMTHWVICSPVWRFLYHVIAQLLRAN